MKISVVMSTYNGEKYINEQLESIYRQTRQPDEVLINDDCSQDNTISIVQNFIEKHNLDSTWFITKNKCNKGCTLNFLDGAMNASGDVIFYSDQDDIWEQSKVEEMINGFVEYPDMLACCCLQNYIDEAGERISVKFEFMSNIPIHNKMFQKVPLDEQVKFNKSPGLCLAIRKNLIMECRNLILDYDLTHDLPIGTIAAIHDGYYVLNRKLMNYRLHGNNFSAPRVSVHSRLDDINEQIKGRVGRYKQMMAIYSKYKDDISHSMQNTFEEAIYMTKQSIDFLQNRNILGLLLMIIQCNPMMNQWIAVNNFLVCLKTIFVTKVMSK